MENKKLWAKDSANLKHLEIIEKFTVGKDKDFDVLLAQYDIVGTKAHCKMLTKIGFLTGKRTNPFKKNWMKCMFWPKKISFLLKME